jgi:predicted transcriptional regulator
MKLNPKTQDFVERIGLTLESLGTTRTLGRLFGLLLVAERPMSLDQLASALQVSKASISTNARVCVQIGLAQQVSVLGDRRDYYEISPGSFERAVAARLGIIQEIVSLADAGIGAVDKGNRTARARLEEMRDFYQFLGSEMAKIMTRWQQSRKPTKARKRQR